MAPHNPVEVISPGAYYDATGPAKVVECWLTHDRFPDFRFRLDWALDTGALLGLGIHSRFEDDPPPGGITKTGVLRQLPLEELVKAARRAFADTVKEMSDDVGFYEVDEHGQVIRHGRRRLAPSEKQRMQASAARGRKRSRATHGRREVYSPHHLVVVLDRYERWINSGGSVQAFLDAERLSPDALDYQKKKAEGLGLFIRSKKRGNPIGARLTDEGRRVLAEGSESTCVDT